jgi:hypothetical protein
MPILPGDIGHLPKLGFGLWRFPPATISIELALVAAGSWLYWRAARSVTAADSGRELAARASWLIFAGGAAVLALDVTGILG